MDAAAGSGIITLCDGNTAVLHWWTCSGGGACLPSGDVTHMMNPQQQLPGSPYDSLQQPNPGWLSPNYGTYNDTISSPFDKTVGTRLFLQCVCDAAFANVSPLWLIPANATIGDCHIHGTARNTLLWIALVSCILGFVYTLIRMAVALPRGGVFCCSSFVAASSLGFRCKPIHRGLVQLSRRNKHRSCRWTHCCYSTRDNDNDDDNTANGQYHNEDGRLQNNNNANGSASASPRHRITTKDTSSSSSTPVLLPAVQQILAARGISIHAGLSLLCLGVYFLFAVCLPFDLIRVRDHMILYIYIYLRVYTIIQIHHDKSIY